MDNRPLPPLPGSDDDSLRRSRTARGFWSDNEIHRINEPIFKKCEHYFIRKPDSVECKKCHFGMLGTLEIKNGKLFHRGEQMDI